MAFSRIRCSKEFPVILSQYNYAVGSSYARKSIIPNYLDITKTVNFHLSGVRTYPNAPQLALPNNIADIFANETARFSPERIRDIATPVLLYGSGSANRINQRRAWDSITSSANRTNGDSHVDSYDCFGAISLNSSMQSMVPKPFCSDGKSTYLNMPGGQWSRDGKYIAEIMHKSHYAVWNRGNNSKNCTVMRFLQYSTDSSSVNKESVENKTLTNAQKLKRAVQDYGRTVIVFHVAISLVSLGGFYIVVSSGLDISSIVKLIPGASDKLETVMTNSSTFLVAYAIHKIFAPIRISITLTATPFIVRHLRKIGILKMPKVSS